MAKKRILEGVVVSDKMDKTVVVLVSTRLQHPEYKKMVLQRKKYKAHDEKNSAKTGDRVKVIEARPLSKEKRFTLLEIVK